MVFESDASSDGVESASSFVIESRRTSYSKWYPMYGHASRMLPAVCSESSYSQFGKVTNFSIPLQYLRNLIKNIQLHKDS